MSVPTLRDLNWSSMAKRRSLPVQFALYPSRRMNGALCPCLIVCENGIEIVRILDPEHKQPFFCLEGMFLLAGLTITTGILRFDLRRERGDYDLTLAGLEPRDGIWAPLSVAQRVATELDLNFSLRTLFSFKHAWSLDQGGKSGVIHNWQVSNQHINPSSYSLMALCKYPFDTFSVLSRGQQINTLIDQEERGEMQKKEVKIFHSLSSSSAAEQRLLRWTVQAIEQLLDIQQNNIDYDDDEINSIWTPTSIDLLMLFSDLSYGQENESFTTNDGKITVTKSQLREMRAQKTNDSILREEEADLADAHTTLILVDCLWKLYMDKTAMPLISQTLEGEQEEKQDGKEKISKQDLTQPDRFTQMHSSIEDIKKVLYTMQKRRPEQSTPPLQRSEGSPQTIRDRLFQITQSQFVIPLFLGIIIGMLLFQLAQS